MCLKNTRRKYPTSCVLIVVNEVKFFFVGYFCLWVSEGFPRGLCCKRVEFLQTNDAVILRQTGFVRRLLPQTQKKTRQVKQSNEDMKKSFCIYFQDAELYEMVDKAREMEEMYGHYFDKKIVNTDLERTFDELRQIIDKLDVEPQWVPAFWVHDSRGSV